MKFRKKKASWTRSWCSVCLVWILLTATLRAQGVTTTTVQGTVYLANGQPASGTVQLIWPAFATSTNQAVAAGRLNVAIGPDGFFSVNLAPNLGATPAGLYYTAVYHLSDGSTNTEYWVVPAASQATLSQVRAQVMPAAQAVQAVNKSYVDQSIAELTQSLLTASGGSLSGPLYLNGDPLQPTQAATKHYVDTEFGKALPVSGGAASGPLTALQLGAAYQVDQFQGADFGAKLQACVTALDSTYGGTCDARNFTGNLTISSNVTISTANAMVQLPCATIATANQIQVSAGTRNVTLHGCALRGASNASGSAGGTVFLYSGAGSMIRVGDPTYAADTAGFHLDNVVINTTASASPTAQGLVAYRTQEMNLGSLYLLGNSNQTGITLDGTGNYTGGTFQDIQLTGFGTALNAIGHQASNSATTDWVNASTFLRLHIDCPTSGGSPIAGTYGINLQQGDGNTFTGGDVEGCSTALHMGPNAQNNMIVGLRNENSSNQVVADTGSSYNNWITGGTMFTGQLTDNGTRNSFLDTFHRSFNGLNGDWYGSQKDATLTNHFRLGTGGGNERGLLNRYQTDAGYRWTTGLSDATGGAQFYQVLDELNSVYRLSIGQYNSGQSSTNNQTVINAAGTGAVVLNGSTNSGTGGVVFGAGGSTGATVATINNAGNAQFNGTLQVGGPSTFSSSTTVKNQADAEIDNFLWAGATASQKESYTYKDYTGASQWYMVKDANNNWALNSATGGLDSFKAYQSTNSGDTYINASNGSGHIRLNYETGSGNETDIYSGSNTALTAAFLGATAIKFPGLAAGSGHNCLQIDNSGYISNTGAACGAGGLNGTVSTGTTGQVAYYTGNGTTVGGTTAVAVTAGGTGATSAAQALQNLGAQAAIPGIVSDGAAGVTVSGNVAAGATILNAQPLLDLRHISFAGGAICDGTTSHDILAPLQSALNVLPLAGGEILIPGSPHDCYLSKPTLISWPHFTGEVSLIVQGNLRIGTSFIIPGGNIPINLIGRSAGGPVAQFQGPGQGAGIYLSPPSGACHGALGTAVSTTAGAGTNVTFTPSTTNCLYAGTGITVAGLAACSINSISRANNIVTAQLSAMCPIAVGTPLTVTGVTDTSFNGGYGTNTFTALSSDRVLETISWYQSGANASSTGGTVSGLNEDSMETTAISSCTGSTCTATFYRSHSAVDQWGVVAVGTGVNAAGFLLKDLHIADGDGTALWLYQTYRSTLQNIGISTNGIDSGQLTNQPIELDFSSFITMDNLGITSGDAPWSIWMTQPFNQPGAGSGPIYVDHSFLESGIKLDHGAGGVFLNNTVIEKATRAAVTVDPTNYWSGNQQQISLENTGLQDNGSAYGWKTCFVYYTTPVTSGTNLAKANVLLKHVGSNQCMTSSYFSGNVSTEFPNGAAQFSDGTPQGVRGTFSDGLNLEAEVRGEQAGLAPAIIPYATLPVPISPSNWPTSSCDVATGVLAPDGTATAGALTRATGAGSAAIYTYTATPAAGDMILYGAWVYSSTPGMTANAGGSGFLVDNYGSSHFSFSTGAQSSNAAFDSQITDDWWHPSVGVATISNADGSSGSIRFSLSCQSDRTMNFWQPFMIYVPASANIPLREVMRWRSQLLHGYVPPSATAGTMYSGYPINLPGDPTSNSQAATKHYVDSHAFTLAPATISTLGGVKCDGATTTCDVDGTVHASISGGSVLTTAGGQTMSAANTVSGLPSGCQQFPCVVAKGTQTGLNSSTDLNLVTSGGAGEYLVSVYGYTTTAGSTGAAMNLCISWNDGYTSSGNTCPVNNISATSMTRGGFSQALHLASGQTIHTYNNCSNGAVCNIDWAVVRMQ